MTENEARTTGDRSSPSSAGAGDASSSLLEAWHASFADHVGSTDLPAHHQRCLGCGPDNPHAHHLVARRDGDAVVAEHVFDERHVGAPGIAHGGAVATVMDDLFGFLLYVVGDLAVTRSLNLDYLAPVLLGERYTLVADLISRDGRKLQMSARMSSSTKVVAEARALFIAVDINHFSDPFRKGGDHGVHP
jgi:acyl-coenzyme A thioesterase PaaI-like protein